jgi:hypothetical protein
MKSVKGVGFGVRFYRRTGTKAAVRERIQGRARENAANEAEDIDALEKAMSRRYPAMAGVALFAFAAALSEKDAGKESFGNDMEINTIMTDIPPQTDKIILSTPEQSAMDKAATRRAQAAEVKRLLAQKTGPGTKELALWGAAKTGNCQRIRLLVMEGVDLDARDAQGRTAINIATQYSQHNALKTLLAARELRRMAALGDLPQTRFYAKFAKTGTGGA